MKKLLALLLAMLVLMSVCLPVSAAGLNIPTIECDGKTYYNLSGKDDYFKAARYGIDNGLTTVPVYIEYSKFPDYLSNNIWYCNVSNFDYTQEGLYFSYREYATSTVCMTAYYHDFENDLEYGDIEISYIDSADELKKGDAMLDAELAKVASYSKKDKIRYVAEYICKNVDAGFEEMPGGGYDIINGVYDLMTGKRTNVVCSSFAFLFQRFMERAGYKSYIATGGNHAWNVVELDGKWYGVDCTYGDNGKALDDEYFLMGMDRLKGYITKTENVFAELEKEKGCQFAPITYGAKATTATTTPTVPKKPTTTKAGAAVSTSGTVVTRGEQTATAAGEVTTTQSTASVSTSTTAAAPVVKVDVSQQAEVTAQVFESAAQNGETLVLQAEEYQWSFAAGKLTNYDASTTLNTAINLGDAVAQEDIAALEEINQEEAFFPFSFEHHGALPGEAEICIRVDESFAQKAVDIYSINAAGEAVKEGSGTVTADGELIFRTNHCSLWFIKEAQPSAAPSAGTVWLIVGAAVVAVAAIGAGVFFFLRKKRA